MSNKLEYEKPEGKLFEYLTFNLTNVFRQGYISCRNVILPEYFQSFGDKIQEMNIRSDDVWVCSFPKSGTTWTQEIVWCIANNLNFEAAQEYLLPERFPFLERSVWTDHRRILAEQPDINFSNYGFNADYELNSVEFVDKLLSPRFIQSHLPFKLLPKKLQENSTSAKVIYVMRHPGDTCVSYYHFYKLFDGYKGTLEDFCELFLQGMICCGPFWDHILDFWEQRYNPNVLIIKYEDMKKDLRSVIYRISSFLSKPLNEDQVEKLLYHVSFENMKKNPAVNYEHDVKYFKKYNLVDEGESFIRQGKVGEWRQTVGPVLAERFQQWTEKNLQGTGLTL